MFFTGKNRLRDEFVPDIQEQVTVRANNRRTKKRLASLELGISKKSFSASARRLKHL